MSKSKNKVELKLVGKSSEDVTGSCLWIKTPDRQILVECGLYQTCGKDSILKQYKINSEHFEFNPKHIDYVFVCHTHQDHLGNVPRLYKYGASCPLIMPEGSRSIAKILLDDSAKIMASDARYLSKRFQRDYTPIYEEPDIDATLNALVEYPIGEFITLDEFVKFRFIPSGHILNSAQLELHITCGNLVKKILYTSDLGNIKVTRRYVNKFEKSGRVNVVVGESTYGKELRESDDTTREKDLERLRGVVDKVIETSNGRILIPVFANSRCQEILSCLYDLFHDDITFRLPILVDSPMAINICEAYEELLSGEEKEFWDKVRNWRKIIWIRDADESLSWRKDTRPAIIVCSSGMITQGRSVLWAQELVPNPNNIIVLCGFSAKGSVGATLKEGKKKSVYISGKLVRNKCQTVNLTSFTSHMQRGSLIDYYGDIDCERVILVHGDSESKLSLAEAVQNRMMENNKTSRVVISNMGYSIKI